MNITSHVTLNVGIVGNRNLPDKNLSAIQCTFQCLWAALATKLLYALNKKGQMAALSMVNSLAEGGDQLAVEIAQKSPYSFQLICPIPFSIEEYKQTLTTDSSQKYFDRCLLEQSSTLQIIELNLPNFSLKQRRQGYRAAADALLEASDILVAIYDPRKKGNTGGTIETVEIALRKGIPFIQIDTSAPEKITFIEPEVGMKSLYECELIKRIKTALSLL